MTNAGTTLTYTAGPFVVANASNNVNTNGQPTCTPARAFCEDWWNDNEKKDASSQ